jgi:hypothetical protein
MYNSFELFFFWRKCSTVVGVGVQTSFLPFAKSVTEKKTTKRGLCGGRQKYCANPEERGVRIFACR